MQDYAEYRAALKQNPPFSATGLASEAAICSRTKFRKWTYADPDATTDEPALRQQLEAHAPRKPANSRRSSASSGLASTSRVLKEGLEPPRPCGHVDLNHARLPIPPLQRFFSGTDWLVDVIKSPSVCK